MKSKRPIIHRVDCNRCNPTIKCKGIGVINWCSQFIPPRDSFSLIEMALNYPNSLNKALSALPARITARVSDYIKI